MNDNRLLKTLFAGALVSACAFTMCVEDANAQRRGGGGGGMSRSGGGGGGSARAGNHGGRTAQSSVSGGNRASAGNRSGNTQRSGGGNTQVSGGDRTRTSGDRTTNIGSNNNVNIEGRDVNIDVEGGCCGGWGGVRYPVAAGITIGAIAGSVAAAANSYYYALPAGCTVVVRGGVSYHQCGSAYYSEAMDGDTIVYVSATP